MKEVVIYTDGACSGNPGPGGWGAVLYFGDQSKEIYGSEQDTTNNKMELTAAIKALAALNRPCKVVIHTDSNYLRNGITLWIHDWKKKNWRTAGNKPVKNIELWKDLEQEIERHVVEWKWVKAHNGDIGNELADSLAVRGRDEAK